MWKIVLGFIVFVGLAFFVLFKAGDKVDLGGEKHGIESAAPPSPVASAAASGAKP